MSTRRKVIRRFLKGLAIALSVLLVLTCGLIARVQATGWPVILQAPYIGVRIYPWSQDIDPFRDFFFADVINLGTGNC